MDHPRSDRRYPIDLPASLVSAPGHPQRVVRVRNVSRAGLLLDRVGSGLEPGHSVWIEIPRAPGRGRLGLVGKVCWHDGERMGVEIEAMLPHHRARFSAFVESLSAPSIDA